MRIVILALLLVLIFSVYSWLPWQLQQQGKYPSPDETANAFFVDLFHRERTLQFVEPLNAVSPSVGPRSMRLGVEGTAPGGFLGLPLFFGVFSIGFGMAIVPYVVPFLATLALLAMYGLLRQLGAAQRFALITILLVAFHPMYWYYASRSFFPNGLFLSFILFGAYGLSLFYRKRRTLVGVLAGISFGISLLIRTSEVFWVFPVLFTLFFAFRRSVSRLQALAFWFSFLATFSLLFFLQSSLYNNPLTLSHSAPGNEMDDIRLQTFFPFGLEIGQALTRAFWNLFVAFPWYSVPFGIGLFLFFHLRRQHERWRFPPILRLVVPVLAILFLLYYGSYEDAVKPEGDTIGLASSSLRFFLPMFVASIPIAAWTFYSGLQSQRAFSRVLTYAGLCLYFVFSVSVLWTDRYYGFFHLAQAAREHRSAANEVSRQTKSNGVVISGYGDKIVFPERRVVLTLPDQETDAKRTLSYLAHNAPLYYFDSPLTPSTFRLQEKILASGFALQQLYVFGSGEVLFRLVPTVE